MSGLYGVGMCVRRGLLEVVRLSAVSCTCLVQVVMSISRFFVSVSVRLKEGEVTGRKVK